MRIASVQNRPLAAGTLIVLLLFQLQSPMYAARDESRQLTQLLADARDEAFELANDADQLELMVQSDSNWVTHAMMLEKIKGHVTNMALIIDKLNKAQKSGSELQEQAVERMLPLVKELSANTTAAIDYLNQNKTRPMSPTYIEYLSKNAETARQLFSMVSSLFEYEKGMTEIEKLRSKLENPKN